jgi:hypothetical protein
MLATTALLFLSAGAWAAVHAAPSLVFEPPVLLSAPLPAPGTDASNVYAMAAEVFVAWTPAGVVGSDGGTLWDRAASDDSKLCSEVSGVPVRHGGGGLLTYGDVQAVPSKYGHYVQFNASSAGLFQAAPGAGGGAAVNCTAINVTTVFQGLPQPVTCGVGAAYGCPFRLEGGDQLALPDGTLLLSAMVYWGGNGQYATR